MIKRNLARKDKKPRVELIRNRELGARVQDVGNCPKNKKKQYRDEEDATKAAKELRKAKGPRVKPYLCLYCNLWHIGHWRPPEFRKGTSQNND